MDEELLEKYLKDNLSIEIRLGPYRYMHGYGPGTDIAVELSLKGKKISSSKEFLVDKAPNFI